MWARQDDPEPSEDALEWGLINAEPLSPDCLRAPVRDAECPSLLITQANPGSAGVRLKNGSHPPSGEYEISELVPQTDDLEQSTFVADPPAEWGHGMCVSAKGQTVSGKVRLSAALSGADDTALQTQCDSLCMAHQIPADWRDHPQYVSGWKRGCELVVGEGWSTAGCYLHSSPLVKIANGAALRYCKLLSIWSADRRRQIPSALSTKLSHKLVSRTAAAVSVAAAPLPPAQERAGTSPAGTLAASVARKALRVQRVSAQRQSGADLVALAPSGPFASMLSATASASESRAAGAEAHRAEDDAQVSAEGSSWRRSRAEAPVCLLPSAPVLAHTVEVLRDAQGSALMNNYGYHLRVRAYNGFQPSVVSASLNVHPVGTVSKGVLNLMAECRNASEPHRCKAGFVGDTRLSVSWEAPFYDDKVTDVLGYRVEVSGDGGATWVQYVKASENDPVTKGYLITCLLNDRGYLLRVAALNMYGLGAWEQIGPLTPRWCPHMEYCNKCHEPFFEMWGGCSPPKCVAPRPLPPRASWNGR